MSIRTHIAPLSASELAFLRRSGNVELHEAYGDALATLHGLAARYSGAWYFVMVPDEAEALAMLEECISSLASAPSLVARLRANAEVVKALRDAAAREGLTDEVRDAGAGLMQALASESEALHSTEADRFASSRAAAG